MEENHGSSWFDILLNGARRLLRQGAVFGGEMRDTVNPRPKRGRKERGLSFSSVRYEWFCAFCFTLLLYIDSSPVQV